MRLYRSSIRVGGKSHCILYISVLSPRRRIAWLERDRGQETHDDRAPDCGDYEPERRKQGNVGETSLVSACVLTMFFHILDGSDYPRLVLVICTDESDRSAGQHRSTMLWRNGYVNWERAIKELHSSTQLQTPPHFFVTPSLERPPEKRVVLLCLGFGIFEEPRQCSSAL